MEINKLIVRIKDPDFWKTVDPSIRFDDCLEVLGCGVCELENQIYPLGL